MKIHTLIIAFMIGIVWCSTVIAADYEKGLAAAQRGEYARALKEWEPLAEKGNADAQRNLALMYRSGRGVPKDYERAIKWYTLSAEQGNAIAQISLGVMYQNGEGVPQNYRLALKWYTLVAEQGNADAQGYLGALYFKGQIVPRDYKQSAEWLTLAAEQGHDKAQSMLGALYLLGAGVPLDNVLAHMWFNIAASLGNEDAIEGRKRAARIMTSDQISEAQKLAQECMKKDYKGCSGAQKDLRVPNPSIKAMAATLPLTINEMDAFKQQVQKCWNLPTRAANAEKLIVTIRMQFNRDGTLNGNPEIVNKGSIKNDFERVVAESARRAVIQCQPYKLPTEKYETWRAVWMNFETKDMF